MTKGNVKIEEAQTVAPVVIEQVFAEKPGGGLVANPEYEVKQGTAVYADGTKFKPIKGYRLYKANTAEDTTMQIMKGSGIKQGDVLGYGKKSVAAGAVDTSNPDYDVVTITFGTAIPKGACLYEAASVSATTAKPKGEAPLYIVGNDVPAGEGDQPVRLINGANIRKETAPVAPEVVALMKNINLV